MTADTSIAIVVNPALPIGLLANTVGAISIGIGAKLPGLAARQLVDRRDRAVDIISSRPVPILQASADVMRALMHKALPQSDARAVVPFPGFARSIHAYADYEAIFPDRDLADEEIDGIGLAGEAAWVKSLTGALKLLR